MDAEECPRLADEEPFRHRWHIHYSRFTVEEAADDLVQRLQDIMNDESLDHNDTMPR